MESGIEEEFAKGRVRWPGFRNGIGRAGWSPLEGARGAFIKQLASGAQTGGRLSSTLVYVRAGCGIPEHSHPGKAEVHHALAGSGSITIDGKTFRYSPGLTIIIPPGARYAIKASRDDGLVLIAVMSPPLA